MTRDEQIVIDVLEHNASQWDASDPRQAQSFRDAASVLTRLANGVAWLTAQHPSAPDETPAPAPLSPETLVIPGTTNDLSGEGANNMGAPPDVPLSAQIIHPTNVDAETPVNG